LTVEELKLELAAILSEEDLANADWDEVEVRSNLTYVRLTEPGTPQNFPYEDVIGYLAGFNRRRLDEDFGQRQRHWLRSYLTAS
jgi:hypothetical protein